MYKRQAIDDALVEGTESVEATLSGVVGANLNAAQAVATTTITETDNTAPVISAQLFTVDENSAAGTAVGAVIATDPDVAVGQFLTYAITGGNLSGAFAIDPATGQLTVVDPTLLDFEVNPSFALTIQVTDSGPGGFSDTATVTIDLNDVDESVAPPPVNPGPDPTPDPTPEPDPGTDPDLSLIHISEPTRRS